jgi:aryl-alcohol dehydrogenase-like predicted oxidoreductase
MRYVKLGQAGLEVSVITLGCMSFGESGGRGRPWTLDEDACRDIMRQALDAGINVFDTANVYSAGRSEEITGKALKDFVPRDEVVLATKVFMPMRRGPNGAGLSRKAIFAGKLTRPWDETTTRKETDEFGQTLYRDEDRVIVDRVLELAAKRQLSPAQVALAWLLRNPMVTSPIVGVTRLSHLSDAIAAVDVELDPDEIAFLEEPYVPHAVAGLQ